jgi:hypothetical protein
LIILNYFAKIFLSLFLPSLEAWDGEGTGNRSFSYGKGKYAIKMPEYLG